MSINKERRREVAQERSRLNQAARKGKSPSKIRRLERRRQERLRLEAQAVVDNLRALATSPFVESSPILTDEQVEAATTGGPPLDLEMHSLGALKDMARDLDIPGRSKMNKGALIQALRSVGVPG